MTHQKHIPPLRESRIRPLGHDHVERIAVIGAGISGLGSAWLLGKHHDVTLFEASERLGGHTNTVTVDDSARELPVDTGFIVYNEKNYPLLTALFSWLRVPTRASDMSFGVSIANGALEYAGDNLNTLFAQRSNLARPSHWRMLLEILRFNRETLAALAADDFGDQTLGEYLDAGSFSARFRYHYLLPMGGAIWSCPVDAMLAFPAKSFARFFENHGLLSVSDRPQWRTVVGGGREYINRLLTDFPGQVRTGSRVTGIRREAATVTVTCADGRSDTYDRVVLACHAPQVLAMLEDATARERELLGAFRTQPNEAFLHSDTSLMPRRGLAWSSWNYLAEDALDGSGNVSVSYWMNRLQSFKAERDYIVSLNPLREPDPGKVAYRTTYQHPVFDLPAIAAQQQLDEIQGPHLFFAGAWTGYGFHEDGFCSAVRVAGRFGVRPPWESPVAVDAVPLLDQAG